MHSDKAKEFLAKSVRGLLKAHGIRQTTNSGYDPAANGIAERWVGIVKVRATTLLAEHRLPPDYWACACRWVAKTQATKNKTTKKQKRKNIPKKDLFAFWQTTPIFGKSLFLFKLHSFMSTKLCFAENTIKIVFSAEHSC